MTLRFVEQRGQSLKNTASMASKLYYMMIALSSEQHNGTVVSRNGHGVVSSDGVAIKAGSYGTSVGNVTSAGSGQL